eukprot:3722789-Rhodomonas_salina.1
MIWMRQREKGKRVGKSVRTWKRDRASSDSAAAASKRMDETERERKESGKKRADLEERQSEP